MLLEDVVKPRRNVLLDRLKLASGREEILEAAMLFRAWDDVVAVLENTPREAEEELKKEGDYIYG